DGGRRSGALGPRRRQRAARRGEPHDPATGHGAAGPVSTATHPGSVWDDVVGQAAAVERLRRAVTAPVHAYLFVGPAGSTKKEAARAFAALLIAGVDDPGHRDVDLVLRGEHPDVKEVARTGPAISFDQAREIVRTASLAPSEGARKV